MWPRPIQLAAFLVATAMAGSVAAQPAKPSRDAETLALGRSLVSRNCSVCHAVGVADVSPRAGAPAFRDLSQRYPIDTLGEALAEDSDRAPGDAGVSVRTPRGHRDPALYREHPGSATGPARAATGSGVGFDLSERKASCSGLREARPQRRAR